MFAGRMLLTNIQLPKSDWITRYGEGDMLSHSEVAELMGELGIVSSSH